jgi:hypothetical protein
MNETSIDKVKKTNPTAINAVNDKWSEVAIQYPTSNKEDSLIFDALSELARTRNYQDARRYLADSSNDDAKLLGLFDILAPVYLNHVR